MTATLQDLHQKYDGPIPREELDAVRGRNTALIRAAGNIAFYERMLQGARDSKATLEAQRSTLTPDGYDTWQQSLDRDIAAYSTELAKARQVVADLTPAMAAE